MCVFVCVCGSGYVMHGDVGERKGEMERENFRDREEERKREKV